VKAASSCPSWSITAPGSVPSATGSEANCAAAVRRQSIGERHRADGFKAPDHGVVKRAPRERPAVFPELRAASRSICAPQNRRQ